MTATHRTSRRFVVAVAAIASAFFAGACSEEALSPAPVEEGASSGTGGAGTGGSEGTPPGPRVRTVETRNPWGGSPGNLLVDGDFEFSVVLQGSQPQAGWFAFSDNGQSYLHGETGGLCKSGMRCAELRPGQVLFGQGTAAKGTGMTAGLWVKVPEGTNCDIVSFAIIRCNFAGNFAADIPPVTAEPDPNGWCRYRGSVSEQSTATCAYIDSALPPETTAIVDQATLLPDDGTAPLRQMRAMTGPRAKRARSVVDTIRRIRPIGDPPRLTPPVGRR